MKQRFFWATTSVLALATLSFASDAVPGVAWRRPLGLPLENPGGKKPEIKDMIDDGYWQGAPVGGFGAGTFSRSYRGDFERWHLKTGVHKYESVPANQFSVFAKREGEPAYAQVLATDAPANHALAAWKWNYPVSHGQYAALYPKSWFQYKTPEMPVELTVEQFSPILPNNYKETSFPVAIYDWYAVNPGTTKVTVSIMFSWTNMVGWFRGTGRGFRDANNLQNLNNFRSEPISGGVMKGIVFDRLRKSPVQEDWDGQFAIAAIESPGVQVSYVQTFLPSGDGADVWRPFSSSGVLPSSPDHFASGGEPLAGAIAVEFTLAPGEKKKIPIVLAWDLPIVEFGNGRKWLRRYTDFFGTSGTNAWQIARTGLLQEDGWSRAIDAWQAPYVNDASKPAWYRGMLFNELYYLADGGTLWGREAQSQRSSPPSDSWKRQTFIYLECFDYPYYSTLDVLFYGSMPTAKFWPELDKAGVREFADTVNQEIPTEYLWIWKTQQDGKPVFRERKVKGSLPHDLGNPSEDPIILVNQFDWQNTNRWKDLNTKYVLMVWRDFFLQQKSDLEFLRYNYAGVKQAMDYLRQFDHDGDGLIENEGYPDQTYDTWVTRGASAYSGGLYLAALRATEEMARVLGESSTASQYHSLFAKARDSYIKKLWNGSYFNYDAESPYRTGIMADQLAGQWYANLTGLGDLVPANMRVSALKKIFEFNVKKFADGDMGALNGMGADGQVYTDNEQIQEVWVGTTFGLCAEMLAEGLRQEAFSTAKGIYDVVYDKKGYWFRTPEAWGTDGMYRASMYMRAGAVWSMEMMTRQEGSAASGNGVR